VAESDVQPLTVSDAEARLRSHGLRITSQRVAMLRAIWQRPHATTEEVVGEVRARIGTVSRQAVYNALAALTAKGLVRRIDSAGASALYDPRVGTHHHLVCRGCGAAVDVDCIVDDAPIARAAELGYRIDAAEVTYWGTCAACAHTDGTHRRPPPPSS
jgi:Fur family transcriptional regulator, stress-responsive regulator